MPQAIYTPLEDEEGEELETAAAEAEAEAGTQTPKSGAENKTSGLEEAAKVVDMDGLGLEPEKKRDAEALPAVGEAGV